MRTEQDSLGNACQKYSPQLRALQFPRCQKQHLSEGEEGIITTSPRTTPKGCCAFHLLPFMRGPYNLHGLNHNLSLVGDINCYGDGGWDDGSF